MVRATLISALGFLLIAHSAAAASGRAVVVQGSAALTRSVGDMIDLQVGEVIEAGDGIEVGPSSYVRLMMADGTVLDLGASTRLVIRDYTVNRATRRRQASLKLWVGRLWARVVKAVGTDDSYIISGGNAVVGIRGTELVFDVREDGSARVYVLEGLVALTSVVGAQAAEEIGAMSRGTVDRQGRLSRLPLTGVEIDNLRQKGRPTPTLDERGSEGRLNSVRERLQIENAPAPRPLDAPAGGADPERFKGRLRQLERLEDDPVAPLLHLDPDTGTTRVRGNVEVIEP